MTDQKLLSHLHRLADTAVSENVRGLAQASRGKGASAGPEADLIAAADAFASAGATYLAFVAPN